MANKIDFTTMHEEMIKQNREDIGELQTSDAKLIERMKSVCDKIDRLADNLSWLWKIILGTVILALVGYVLNFLGIGA